MLQHLRIVILFETSPGLGIIRVSENLMLLPLIEFILTTQEGQWLFSSINRNVLSFSLVLESAHEIDIGNLFVFRMAWSELLVYIHRVRIIYVLFLIRVLLYLMLRF